MQDIYTKKRMICYTDVDKSGHLALPGTANLMQDSLTEYLGSLGAGNDTLKNCNNAAWVMTRSLIHIWNLPYWRDVISLESYTTGQSAVRLNVETAAMTDDGSLAFLGIQENTVIDFTSRRIRKISTTSFPDGVRPYPSRWNSQFEKLKTVFGEEDKVRSCQVFWTETDYTEHTNNVTYFNYMLDTVPSTFFEHHPVTDFQIHYIKESREGDILTVYRKDIVGAIDFLIQRGDEEIIRARMRYVP